MCLATSRGRTAVLLVSIVLLGSIALLGVMWGGRFIWQHFSPPPRPHYLLINQTGQHDYDLAFRMSLRLAERKSGIENALVLLPSLPPSNTIEQTATDLFTQMQIGARSNGRGILYLYSAQENLLKIEVSYALEGDIPDVYCHRLEEAARTYMLSEVPQDFISELIITTNLLGSGAPRTDTEWSSPTWLNAAFLSGGGGALVHGYERTLADYDAAIRQLPKQELHEYEPASDVRASVERYLASLAAGIGDPRLPLLTEGSRLFRAVVPRDESQQRRIAQFYRAAAPYQVLFAGDLALVVPRPDHSNLPMVFRRGTDGLWYVDEAKSWTYFHRFEDNVNFFVKYGDNPFLGALRALSLPNMGRAIYGAHVSTPPLAAYPFSLQAAVRKLEDQIHQDPRRAANYAALGDLYLFEANWLSKAIAAYETASELAPTERTYRWRLVDLYMNASRADKMLTELRYLAENGSRDAETRAWYDYYRKQYSFSDD